MSGTWTASFRSTRDLRLKKFGNPKKERSTWEALIGFLVTKKPAFANPTPEIAAREAASGIGG